MNEEQIMALIEIALVRVLTPIRADIEALAKATSQAIAKMTEEEHYHDEYASVSHVERSEHSVDDRLHILHNKVNRLEYEIGDVRRKAEDALHAAHEVKRNSHW